MMKFGKLKGAQPKRPRGKPGLQELLPSRHAMSQLVAGDPTQRSLGNYAKLTPSGAGAPGTYPAIMSEGQAGADVEPDTGS
jgi:hypothetical protein